MAYKDKEKERETNRKWREANHERVKAQARERSRKWRAANLERAREINRKYRAANLELVRERTRENGRRYRAENPEKYREQRRKWKLANPASVQRTYRKTYIQSQHGMTVDEYNNMLSQQNDCCAICEIHYSEFKDWLCVDHDHKTGKIRGLLCHRCNTAIGKFEDNAQILQNAIQYLRQH